MSDRDYHAETQLQLFAAPGDGHDVSTVSHVGTWYRCSCSCGWLGRVAPSRAAALRQHVAHVRYARTCVDDRPSRRGSQTRPRDVETMRDLGCFGGRA